MNNVNDVYTSRVRDLGESFYAALANSGLVDGKYLSGLKQMMDKEVYALLSSPKPRIMVYGIYNSGKSTLVNAIMGKPVAEVADRPMTWKIAEYDTGSYVLIDSPGVDAPKEHEQIADSKLRECHVILFVVSSKGGFESEANYRKMLELIRMDIPFYIVLNDRGFACARNASEEEKRQARQIHERELEDIRRKILENLQRYSQDRSIGSRYTVIPLNAKRAWLGVEKGKPELIEKSGVRALENRIASILNSEGALEWLRTPQKHLIQAVEEAETVLMARQSDNRYVDERRILQQKQFGAEEELKGRIQLLVSSHRDAAYRMQLGGDENISEMLADLQRDVENACREQLLPLGRYVEERFRELGVSVDGSFALSYTAPKFAAMDPLKKEGAPKAGGGSADSGKFGDSAEKRGSGAGGALLNTAAGAAVGSLASGAVNAAAPAVAGALGSTALGTAAGGALGTIGGILGGPVGAIIGAGIGLLKSIFDSSSKQREEDAMMRREVAAYNARIQQMVTEQTLRRQEARNRADRYLDELERELRRGAAEIVKNCFGQIIAGLDRAIEEHTQFNNNLKDLLAQLRQIREELHELKLQTA